MQTKSTYTVELKRNLDTVFTPISFPERFSVANQRVILTEMRQPIGSVLRIVRSDGAVVKSIMVK